MGRDENTPRLVHSYLKQCRYGFECSWCTWWINARASAWARRCCRAACRPRLIRSISSQWHALLGASKPAVVAWSWPAGMTVSIEFMAMRTGANLLGWICRILSKTDTLQLILLAVLLTSNFSTQDRVFLRSNSRRPAWNVKLWHVSIVQYPIVPTCKAASRWFAAKKMNARVASIHNVPTCLRTVKLVRCHGMLRPSMGPTLTAAALLSCARPLQPGWWVTATCAPSPAMARIRSSTAVTARQWLWPRAMLPCTRSILTSHWSTCPTCSVVH